MEVLEFMMEKGGLVALKSDIARAEYNRIKRPKKGHPLEQALGSDSQPGCISGRCNPEGYAS